MNNKIVKSYYNFKNLKLTQGEEKILYILKREKINFIREKTFKDLKRGLLRYDFFLPEKNIILEYDGIQHFQQISYFYKSRQDFLKAQERDRKKNSYALAHKIPLYRIPYWEIENIKSFKDIIKDNFLVKSIWHNDNLKVPK